MNLHLAKRAGVFCALAAWLCGTALAAEAAKETKEAKPASEVKLEATLVWGTNEAQSPNPDHKPVCPEVEKKLKDLPFRWKYYFEVKRKQFQVAEAGTQKVVLSKDCQIVVKNLGKTVVAMDLLGKGERVGTIKQRLPKGEVLVTGGNAANFTGWFVVLKVAE
jgi:hypothetical protein